MAKSVYDTIKKQNGEGFARVLRDKNLLDIPDIANIVKYAGHDAASAEQIFPYLWSLKIFEETHGDETADPFKLLDQAGYHAFEVHNLDEQNSIKRFFRKDEELCTFRDEHRYQNNYMIHAIKHEVWHNPRAIKPSKNPERQDEYGTSVISIQIHKDGNFISIKNRYNHTVANPDQTFHSNPDEIIAGLSAALKAYFDVDWKSTGVTVPDGFVLYNNQILKINFEIENCYFGDGFYAQNGRVFDIDKNNQVQLDYFIWDNQQKKLLNPSGTLDGFIQTFNEHTNGKKVTISGKAPHQTILVDGEKFIELANNQIVTLNMPGVTDVNLFLRRNRTIQELNMPDLAHAGNNFLANNVALKHLVLPSLIDTWNCFLSKNSIIDYVYLPRLKNIGQNFLPNNQALTELDLPAAEIIQSNFLLENQHLRHINFGNITKIHDNFLKNNQELLELNAPKLKILGDACLVYNCVLQQLNAPSLKYIGHSFLQNNLNLHELNLPNLTRAESAFLACNEKIQNLYAPQLEAVGYNFLADNTALTEIDLPSLKSVDERFLYMNTDIQHANLPNLEDIDVSFLAHNKKLKQLSLPGLTLLPEGFLSDNNHVILNLPRLEKIIYDWTIRDTKPAINTPITDVIPERRNIAQRFKHAIKKIYDIVKITYHTHGENNI
ncbi:MAG: leucine-rich repeat protein [Alphaproteobacteria bacterium]|nr:leucine-rich repeat protein [Alphaproteobacteria bacterium]